MSTSSPSAVPASLRRVVAVALKTDAPDPQTGRVVELCALARLGDDPPAPLEPHPRPASPAAAWEGILAAAPPDAVWIVHDADPASRALQRLAPGGREVAFADTALLARICFPTLTDYDLPALCRALKLGAPPEPAPAALCAATLRLWSRLCQRAAQLPHPLPQELTALFSPTRDGPLRAFFRAFADARRAAPALDELYGKAALPPRRQLALPEVHAPLDPQSVAALFAAGGALAAALRGYEPRPEQSAMAHAVAEAFNAGRLLLVEAGTGVGKSLAYLAPAALWSAHNEWPVVVSTSTKNLQAQLIEKDLPLLARALRAEIKAAVLKGRRNYLCLRKLLFALRHGLSDFDRAQRLRLAAVLVWSTATATGDIAECWAAAAVAGGVNDDVTCAAGECHGPRCALRARCFLHRARRRALAADIVIANHAVVLSDLAAGEGGGVLPDYRHLILDEAHNLEAAATAAFSVEVSVRHLGYLLHRLWRAAGRRGGHGLIPLLARQLERSPGPLSAEACAACSQFLGRAATDLQTLWTAADRFFAALAERLPPAADRGALRIRADRMLPSEWHAARAAKETFVAAMAAVVRGLDGALQILNRDESAAGRFEDFTLPLRAIAEELRAFMTDVDFVLRAEGEDFVYWIERLPPRFGHAAAWAAPLRVGPRLFDDLYAKKEAVVFTSATLSVNGSLAYVRKRLGVDLAAPERVAEVVLGSPFEYPRQCLALTPTFLPEPDDGQGGYAEALGCLLADVFRRTRGRAMALFTSYDMLQRTAAVLRRRMADDGFPILVQGDSGSREAILEAFKTNGAAILLGTHSFWEGVDVIGEALSCLVVARLPFAVFTDPIMEARAEQVEAEGESAFMGFSLPNAVIKLRQGFGRLIRSRTDRGIVIIADRRIVAKRYGQWFCRSLPVSVRPMPDRAELLRCIETFFAEAPAAPPPADAAAG